MYQSIVKQKNTSKQSDELSSNFLSGGKGSFMIETIQENSASAAKQQPKIKPRDLSSPYSQSINQNNMKKKKIQSQSVEKYSYKQKKNPSEKPWKVKQKNVQTQEEDNKDLQTTGFSDLKASQNNLQSNKEQFKRSTNSPTQYLFSSTKQNQQQLTSSVEYSTNHLHNISTTTTTTAASRGNSRISKNTQHSNKTNQNAYLTNNTAQSKSPKYYQSPNQNQGSINPWNINASRKLNFNQLNEDSQQDSHYTHQKNMQRTQEFSPENNRSQNKDNSQSKRFTGGITSGLLTQKSIYSPTEFPSDSKKSREIQSANFETIKEKSVKGIKHNSSQNKQLMDRTISQNINAVKNQQNTKPTSETRIDPSTKFAKKSNKEPPKLQTTKPQKSNTTIQPQKQNKNNQNSISSNNNVKETFNKKLNQKIQQKKFERSSNDINSASDTEYFEMSQKFSTIGDPRLFQIENIIGGQGQNNVKQQSTTKQTNPSKPQLKYPNYKSEQKKQNDKIINGYNQPILDDEIEENIETESKHSQNNSPRPPLKAMQQQEVEIEEIVDIYDDNQHHSNSQPVITQDFKDSHKLSCIPQLNHLTMSNVMQKETQEGHDGDHEDNSGDYTDYEKQKKINSTGLSFTKPNLAVKRNESYASDLQKTQEKIFQKYSNPNQNCNNNPHHNFVTQEEQVDYDYCNVKPGNSNIEEVQEDELNQSQTRFLKDQIQNMIISNLRPFTPPFNQVYQMNSSNLRQKKDSIISNLSNSNKNNHHFNQMQHQESFSVVNKSSLSSHRDDGEIEVFYDDILNCYYDPKTNQYYELKA